jgi:hypothetical protein
VKKAVCRSPGTPPPDPGSSPPRRSPTSYDGSDPNGTVGGGSAGNYGTDANFQANYRLSAAFLGAHKGSFTSANRIWIGGYSALGQDMTDYDALLTQQGIAHTTGTPTSMAHRWDSGWVPRPWPPSNRTTSSSVARPP